jgi:hypothetical protein
MWRNNRLTYHKLVLDLISKTSSKAKYSQTRYIDPVGEDKAYRKIPTKDKSFILIVLKISTDHGMICPTIPIGSWRVYINWSWAPGIVSPTILSTHPASRILTKDYLL